MEELIKLIEAAEALQAQVAALEAEIAALKAENSKLKARLGVTPAVDEPLKEYPSVEAIVWERWPDTKESWSRKEFSQIAMQRQIFGPDKIKLPFRNVLVKGEEIRCLGSGWDAEKGRGGMSMPDWYAIAQHRVIDLLSPTWCAYVQAGDDTVEEDRGDQEALIKRYAESGRGFRYPLSSWDGHQRGKELKQVYLSVRPDPGGTYRSARIEVAPAP